MNTTLDVARIRLEGQLEVVERATESLERHLAQFPEHVAAAFAAQRAPALREAELRVRSMSDQTPALASAIGRLNKARARFNKKVARHAKFLELPTMELEQTVAALEAEPVVFVRKTDPSVLVLGSAQTLIALFIFANLDLRALLVVPGLAVIGLVVWQVTRDKTVVTTKRLITRLRAIPLASIRSVEVKKPPFWARDRRFEVRVDLPSGTDVLRFARRPTELVQALRRVGVMVHD